MMNKQHLVRILMGVGLSTALSGAYCYAEDLPPPPATRTKEVVLVLDNSGSMRARDRHFWVRQVTEEFIANSDPLTKVAVVLFDKEGRIELPLRQASGAVDSTVQSALEKLNYRGQWTNISAALRRALEALNPAGHAGAAKTIVLLTDGKLETGDKQLDTKENTFLKEQFLAQAGAEDIRVYAVGLGSTADTDLLQQIARDTHGDYYWTADGEGLKPVFQHIRRALDQDARVVAVATEPPAAGTDMKVVEVAPATAAPVAATPQVESRAPVAATAEPAASAVPDTAVAADSGASDGKTRAVRKPVRSKRPRPEDEVPAADAGDAAGSWTSMLPLGLMGLGGLLIGYLMKTSRRDEENAGADQSLSPLGSSAARACLYDLTGITGRERHELSSSITLIGRVPPSPGERFGHITINSPTIGRRHAVIEYKHYGFWLLDQNSKNGSFVNDIRTAKEVCLSHGDRIRFHEYEFEFSLLGMGLADETTGTGELVLERRTRKV